MLFLILFNSRVILASQKQRSDAIMQTEKAKKEILINEITEMLKESNDMSLIRMIYLILLKG